MNATSFIVVNTIYRGGDIVSTYSVKVNQNEFNKFWNTFQDGTHVIEIKLINHIEFLHIKLYL